MNRNILLIVRNIFSDSPEQFSVFFLSDLVSVPQMLLQILDRDVADPALHHLHHRQRIRFNTSPQLPDPVQILLPVDT